MKRLGQEWIGSVSSGTMHTEDIFNAVRELLPVEMQLDIEVAINIEDEETASYILNEEAFDYLDEIAPEGCYFGSHPGDGADFGFWPNEEGEEE